jgi:uncharacterized protein (TIGR02001 family)
VTVVRLVTALLLGAIPVTCLAQASFSTAVASDYRYRGISLSDDGPSPQLGMNLDTASGAYVGASLTRARLRYTRVKAQAIVYAGWAQRASASVSWDAGVSATRFSGTKKYDYAEWYTGLNSERLGARLSLSPRYFGVGGRSAYLEVNGSRALTEQVDLVGHVGYLHVKRGLYQAAPRYDLRVGVATLIEEWNVQLAWTATRANASLYQGGVISSPRRFVLSVAHAF